MPTPAEIEEQMLHVSDNMVPSIIAVNVVCLTIACIAIALRFQARRVARIRYEADDWLILVGLVRRTFFGPSLHDSVICLALYDL